VRRREANLGRILDQAMEMVAGGGFASLSMNKLADAVDYTPGALYRYFDSKDALFGALVDRILGEIRGLLESTASEVPIEQPLVRIFALTQAYRRFSIDETNKFSLLAMSMAEPYVLLSTADSTDPVVHSIAATLSPLADALSAAETAGLLEPGLAHERTILVFSSVQGVVQLRKQARIAPALLDLTRLSVSVVRTLLLGWGARAAAVDAAYEEVVALGLAERAGGSS